MTMPTTDAFVVLCSAIVVAGSVCILGWGAVIWIRALRSAGEALVEGAQAASFASITSDMTRSGAAAGGKSERRKFNPAEVPSEEEAMAAILAARQTREGSVRTADENAVGDNDQPFDSGAGMYARDGNED